MPSSYTTQSHAQASYRAHRRVMNVAWRIRPLAFASRLMLLTGVLAVLVASAALIRAVYLDRAQAMERQWQHQLLLARLFEDQVTRELDAAHFALVALAQALPTAGPPSEAWNQSAIHALSLQRSVREFVLLNSQGQWVGGTRPRLPDEGVKAPAVEVNARHDAQTRSLRPVLGRWTAGRFWGDWLVASDPKGIGYVPFVLTVHRADGVHRLVANLHSEGWSVAMRAVLASSPESASVLSFSGQTLAHSGSAELGSSADSVVDELTRANKRFGQQEVLGANGQAIMRSWRQVGQRPLWLVVERDVDSVTEAWWQQARAQVAGAAVMPFFLCALLWVGWRGLRRHERQQRRIARSHEALTAQAGELSQVIRSVQEFLFRTDAKGALVFASGRARSLFDLPPESLIGQRLASLFGQGQDSNLASLFSAPMDSHARSARCGLVDSIGVERWFDVTVVPMVDTQGELGFAGSAVECTQQALLQQQLESQARFHARLVESSPLPISLLDDMGCYLHVNAAWEQLFGRSRQEVLGSPAADLHAQTQAKEHEAIDRRLREKGGSLGYETWLPTKDGKRRRFHVTKLRLPEDAGSPPSILCLVTELPAHAPDQGLWRTLATNLAAQLAHMQRVTRQKVSYGQGQQRADAQTWLDWDEQLVLMQCTLKRMANGVASHHGDGAELHDRGDLGAILRMAHAEAVAALTQPAPALRWQLPEGRLSVGCSGDTLLPLLRRLFLLCLQAHAQHQSLVIDLRHDVSKGSSAISWSGLGTLPDLAQSKVSELAAAMGNDFRSELSCESLSGMAWRVTLYLSVSAAAPS